MLFSEPFETKNHSNSILEAANLSILKKRIVKTAKILTFCKQEF
jgi:hypothetical protein